MLKKTEKMWKTYCKKGGKYDIINHQVICLRLNIGTFLGGQLNDI